MKIIVECEINEDKINEIINLETNTHLKSEQAIKDIFLEMLEEDIFDTLEDNQEIFTKINYKII